MNELLIESLKNGIEIYTEEDFLRDIKEDREYYGGIKSLEKLNDVWDKRTKGYKYCFKVVGGDGGFLSIPYLIQEFSKGLVVK